VRFKMRMRQTPHQDLGCRGEVPAVERCGVRVLGLGARCLVRVIRNENKKDLTSCRCLGFRFKVAGFRDQGQGLGFRVQGSGFRVYGLGFKVQGSGTWVEGWV